MGNVLPPPPLPVFIVTFFLFSSSPFLASLLKKKPSYPSPLSLYSPFPSLSATPLSSHIPDSAATTPSVHPTPPLPPSKDHYQGGRAFKVVPPKVDCTGRRTKEDRMKENNTTRRCQQHQHATSGVTYRVCTRGWEQEGYDSS